MTDEQSLILLFIFVAACIAVGIAVGVSRARKRRKASPQKPKPAPMRPEVIREVKQAAALRQNLRLKGMYDEAKIDRLIDFEREELKRKGLPEETLESLMERAIARWERENAG